MPEQTQLQEASTKVEASAIEIVEVVSSTITRIGYDSERQLLYVKFQSGDWYAFKDVLPTTHQEFIESELKGKHFHAKIKSSFLFAKVVADENGVPIAPEIDE